MIRLISIGDDGVYVGPVGIQQEANPICRMMDSNLADFAARRPSGLKQNLEGVVLAGE